MKKNELKKLAFLGLASGLMAASVQAEAAMDINAMEPYLLAKPACKGPGGCGGLTASRDRYTQDDDQDLDDNDDDGDDVIDNNTKKKPFPQQPSATGSTRATPRV